MLHPPLPEMRHQRFQKVHGRKTFLLMVPTQWADSHQYPVTKMRSLLSLLTSWMGQTPGRLAQRKGKCSEVPRGSEHRVPREPTGFVVLMALQTLGEAT